MKTEKQKAAEGLLYDANNDPELQREMLQTRCLLHEYNLLPPDRTDERDRLIRRIVHMGEGGCIISPFYFIVAAKLVSDGILRGAGLMKRFMIATFTDLVLRVALAEILSRTALGTTGIWLSWPIGWTIATILSLAFYATIKWEKRQQEIKNPVPQEG